MSFPRTLANELQALGCQKAAALVFSLPPESAPVAWQLRIRTLGFGKDQIDGALWYRHARSTPFGWHCLKTFAGPRWQSVVPEKITSHSPGFAVGPVAGWRSDFRFNNAGLSPDLAATKLAADIRDQVLPFLAQLRTEAALLDLLCQDQEPFPWYRSQGLQRLAEVALLERLCGRSTSAIPALVDRAGVQMVHQLDQVEMATYVSRVVSAARDLA